MVKVQKCNPCPGVHEAPGDPETDAMGRTGDSKSSPLQAKPVWLLHDVLQANLKRFPAALEAGHQIRRE
jgi:hypothetical protein